VKTLHLPSSFKARIANTFGDKGKAWLETLPDLILECESRFHLKMYSHIPNLSFNYVAEAIQKNGAKIIVKLCVPSKEVENEINALQLLQSNEIVKLLDFDSAQGILLLENLSPGKMLSTLNDDTKATAIVANIIKQIGKPISNEHSFPTTLEWFARLEKPLELPTGFSISLIDKAKHIAKELHQDMGDKVLLHGDLHHFNILSQKESWVAIDPKGVVGEREYEVGAFLRNPIPNIATTMNTKKIVARRVDQLREHLNFDKQKISAWSFAQAILAAVWCVDSKSDDWKLFLICSGA
jgi:streptomycin 6-kinase